MFFSDCFNKYFMHRGQYLLKSEDRVTFIDERYGVAHRHTGSESHDSVSSARHVERKAVDGVQSIVRSEHRFSDRDSEQVLLKALPDAVDIAL